MMKKTAIAVAISTMAVLGAGCTRPTPQESTYRLNLDNEYSWQGQGPDLRMLWPWYETEKISHTRQMYEFPRKLEGQDPLSTEQIYAIITADKQIMLPKLFITYHLKAEPDAVERYYVQHLPEHRQNLERNLDGVIRTHLQTKTKEYLDTHQPTLGLELVEYVRNYRAGGVPVTDAAGNVTGFTGGLSLEEEWGIEIDNIETRGLQAPAIVQSATGEAQGIVSTGRTALDTAKSEAERRRSKLRSMELIVHTIGDNPNALAYLSVQATYDAIEQLPTVNIGDVRMLVGFPGDAAAAYGRQTAMSSSASRPQVRVPVRAPVEQPPKDEDKD